MIQYFKTRNDFIEILKNKDLIIAEAGVFRGDFSEQLLKTNPKELHLIDPFKGVVGSGDKDGLNLVECDMEVAYKMLSDRYENESRVYLHKSTCELFMLRTSILFDFIYVDADHAYHTTLHQLIYSYSKLKVGGILAGHDLQLPGVANALSKFMNKLNLDFSYLTTDDLCPSYGLIKI